MFLDAQHAPIAAAREASLTLERRVFRTSYGDGIFVGPPAATYAIVYTAARDPREQSPRPKTVHAMPSPSRIQAMWTCC